MTAVRHCDLCDLPFEHYTHGLATRQAPASKRRNEPTLKNRSSKSAAPKQVRAKAVPSVVFSISLGPQRQVVVAKPKCSKCGKKAPHGRYSLCSNCLIKQAVDHARRTGGSSAPTRRPRRRQSAPPAAEGAISRSPRSLWRRQVHPASANGPERQRPRDSFRILGASHASPQVSGLCARVRTYVAASVVGRASC